MATTTDNKNKGGQNPTESTENNGQEATTLPLGLNNTKPDAGASTVAESELTTLAIGNHNINRIESKCVLSFDRAPRIMFQIH